MSNGRIYSKRVEIDGFKFDSEMEGEFYTLLKDLQKVDLIRDLRIHPSYVLQEEFVNGNDRVVKQLTYEPDFVFYDVEYQKQRFVDVKGFATDDFLIKWKLFDKWLNEHCQGCYLEVLKYSKTTGFVDYYDYKKIKKSKRQQVIEERNYYKNIVMKQKRQEEIAKNKELREIKRLNELEYLKETQGLSKAQQKRYDELYVRYRNG